MLQPSSHRRFTRTATHERRFELRPSGAQSSVSRVQVDAERLGSLRDCHLADLDENEHSRLSSSIPSSSF